MFWHFLNHFRFQTTAPIVHFYSYDSGVFCHVTLTPFSQCSVSLFRSCTVFWLKTSILSPKQTPTLQRGGFFDLKDHSGLGLVQFISPVGFVQVPTWQTEEDSQPQRLPGRPLRSLRGDQSSHRDWVGPTRPQRRHGPGAQLALRSSKTTLGDETRESVWLSLLTEFDSQDERWVLDVSLPWW